MDAADAGGRTALAQCCAAPTNSVEVAELLLASGASVDRGDNKGWTPLCWAAAQDNVPLMKVLLKKGANPEVQTANWFTPASCACLNGAIAAMELLLAEGIDADQGLAVCSEEALYAAPLVSAARKGRAEMVEFLIGKDLVALATEAYHYAREAGHEAVVELLEDYQ